MIVGPTLDEVRWLRGEAATGWLARLSDDANLSTQTVACMRRQLSAAEVRLICEQHALRLRARKKFSRADRMFFNRVGLEQATDEHVARYKAGRFPAGALAWDLCCGVGGDLLALADRGPVIGADRHPGMAALAAANLRVAEACDATSRPRHASLAVAMDAASADLATCGAWHIDPDRRPQGRRTTRVALHEPGLEAIERLLQANPNGAVKLAPAADVPPPWTERAELEWLARDGECRQLVAWFGQLATQHGRRRATLLGRDGRHTFCGRGGASAPTAVTLGRYVFEPDPAVLAAGLTGELAGACNLARLAPDVAYLTGDVAVANDLLAAFEVRAELPFDMRRVKALLRERGWGRLEVKKRGVDIDPEQVRKRLRVDGDEPITLLLSRRGHSVQAILARRLAPRPAI